VWREGVKKQGFTPPGWDCITCRAPQLAPALALARGDVLTFRSESVDRRWGVMCIACAGISEFSKGDRETLQYHPDIAPSIFHEQVSHHGSAKLTEGIAATMMLLHLHVCGGARSK
jgi:hypothetical protein